MFVEYKNVYGILAVAFMSDSTIGICDIIFLFCALKLYLNNLTYKYTALPLKLFSFVITNSGMLILKNNFVLLRWVKVLSGLGASHFLPVSLNHFPFPFNRAFVVSLNSKPV